MRWLVEVVGSPAGGSDPKLARRIACQHSKVYYWAIVLIPGCIVTPHQYINIVIPILHFQESVIIERFVHFETSESKST